MNKSILMGAAVALFGFSNANAQINLGSLETAAMGAATKGLTALTFSDSDAALVAKGAGAHLDSTSVVALPTDPYSIRLNRVFAKHKNENGLTLNYKVYKTKDVNAFAMADGTVRVYSGLMDIMDDNQLLAVIGHEIGHVAHHDSRNAAKAAYEKSALMDVANSQTKVAAITSSQYGQIANALYDAHYTRGQEANADTFSYDFMKSHGYNVNAVESAFNVLVQVSQGGSSNIIDQMMSSHPDSAARAATAHKRAVADGLYQPYTQQAIVNTAPVKTTTAKKAPAKKTTAKKK